jgi:hypothetical protein
MLEMAPCQRSLDALLLFHQPVERFVKFLFVSGTPRSWNARSWSAVIWG